MKQLTMAERAERGKAARASVPRERHAGWTAPAGRADPVALLESQAADRVPELLPIRYGRIGVSPFTFYRGAALLMARDLASTPTSGLEVQACGDAHLSNFGLFASPERNLMFDANDFDETLPGPWEWDVKRLAASLEVAGRDNCYPRKQRRRVVLASALAYREAMRSFAGMGNLDVWYSRADAAHIQQAIEARFTGRRTEMATREFEKARTRSSAEAFGKLCAVDGGRTRIIADPPLVVPLSQMLPPDVDEADLVDQMSALLARYRRTLPADRRNLFQRYRFADMAHKVVGVGSVGTRCWIVLLEDRDGSDPLFLQVKQAQESVLAGGLRPSRYDNQGQRVVEGQRLMQAASDIFLGWLRATGLDDVTRDFYVRQLRDWKLSVDIDQLKPAGMQVYGELCAWTLARAHARSGDAVAIAAYLGSNDAFDRAVADFADGYADQNERDYDAFTAAVKAGHLPVRTDL
jgi:uncharacterized protein (DUF2252 family)